MSDSSIVLSEKPFPKELIKTDKKGIFQMEINAITGKQGDIWVSIAPSIDVSGYGETQEEARESFKHNLNLFANDLSDVTEAERNDYLRENGWIKNTFFAKKFSKAFVDKDGILQNLENPSISLQTLAA